MQFICVFFAKWLTLHLTCFPYDINGLIFWHMIIFGLKMMYDVVLRCNSCNDNHNIFDFMGIQNYSLIMDGTSQTCSNIIRVYFTTYWFNQFIWSRFNYFETVLEIYKLFIITIINSLNIKPSPLGKITYILLSTYWA